MSHLIFLQNALLLDPEAGSPELGSLLLRSGRILERRSPAAPPPPDAEVRDLDGAGLAPGFIDLHYHGALVFAEPDAAHDAMTQESASLLRQGTTSFLPTTLAWSRDRLAKCVDAWVASCAASSWPGATPLGLHLEGPWINAGAAGAQPAGGIRPFEAAEGADLLARASGLLRMVTLAPELPGSDGLVEMLRGAGVVASLGHSLADEKAVERGVERGMTHVTHLFNAMSGMHHREPGVAGAALAEDRLTCDLICDGVHVHPQVVRTAARAKGERLVLITDRIAVPPSAGSAGSAEFGSGAVHDDGSALRLADGTLAGSRLDLARAAHNAQAFGAMTRLEAIAACSLRPARVLGIENERGSLRPGARADLVVLGADASVHETWVAGERRFSAAG